MTLSRMRPLLFAAACAACATSACALLGKSDPVVPRYFTPMDDGASPARAMPGAGGAAQHPELRLRLGRIDGFSHLREPLVVRTSPQEVTFRDGQRWTERPEVYLRAELRQAFFEQGRATEAIVGRAPILDVELTAFEEIPQPQDRVRVQLVFSLRDDRVATAEETITVEQPVAAGKGEDPALAVVAAYSQALRGAVGQLVERVMPRLPEAPAAQ